MSGDYKQPKGYAMKQIVSFFFFTMVFNAAAAAQSLPTPQVQTQVANDNSTKAASTAFVHNAFRQGLPTFAKFLAYGVVNTPITAFSFDGTAGIASGIRTSDIRSPFNDGLSIVSWAFQDDSMGRGAWAHYAETRKFTTASGYAHAQELEIANLSGVPSSASDPYDYAPGGATFGQIIGSGGQCKTIACPDYDGANRIPSAATVATTIVGNTARFQRGLNFAYDSLMGTDGLDHNMGVAHAINLARGQMIDWYSRSSDEKTNNALQFGSLVSSRGVPLRLIASDNGFEFQSFVSGNRAFRIAVPAHVANGISAIGGSTGNGVILAADGIDVDVNATLQSKGLGWVFVSNTAGNFALSPTGKLNEPAFTPASSNATCTKGDRAWDANYEYRCVAENTWKRTILSNF